MTREEARYYLQSSGFSEEQMDTIEQAFTCEDCISRQAAIDAIYKMHMNGKEGVLHDLKTETGSDALFAETIADAVETLEDLPSVNPQEPKTGHWITKPHIYGVAFCSECDFELRIDDTKYCPNCGAKMVEPQETETWNGMHGQITAPKGTFERIFNEADDDSDI